MRLSTRETVTYGEIWFTALFASTTFGNPLASIEMAICFVYIRFLTVPQRELSAEHRFLSFFSVVNSNKCKDTQEDNASTKFLLLLALLGKSFLRWVIALGMRKERWKVEISPHEMLQRSRLQNIVKVTTKLGIQLSTVTHFSSIRRLWACYAFISRII